MWHLLPGSVALPGRGSLQSHLSGSNSQGPSEGRWVAGCCAETFFDEWSTAEIQWEIQWQISMSGRFTRPGEHTKSDMEHGPVEIVDLPTKKWWFSIAFCMFTRGRLFRFFLMFLQHLQVENKKNIGENWVFSTSESWGKTMGNVREFFFRMVIWPWWRPMPWSREMRLASATRIWQTRHGYLT